jgi:hypothetical protein
MTAPAASQAAIERALAAAKAQGLQITGFSVTRDGTVRIDAASLAAADPVDKPAASVQPLRPRQWTR